MITIIDYGMGNLGSVENMLRRSRTTFVVSSHPQEIERSSKLILPGVGAFDLGVSKLKESGLWQALKIAVEERGARFLGICLGMQLLAKGSEEGVSEGLGWIDGVARKFRFDNSEREGRFMLRVPHMAWRNLQVTRATPLLEGLEIPRFYFVHSYYLPPQMPETVAEAIHGGPFTALVESGKIYGAQFHPEKSHAYGMRFLENYSKL